MNYVSALAIAALMVSTIAAPIIAQAYTTLAAIAANLSALGI